MVAGSYVLSIHRQEYDVTDDIIGEHTVGFAASVVGVANFNEHNTVNRKLSGFASCK